MPSFFTLQLSSKEIATKKEQISEALQATQLFLAKHGDKYVGSHCPFRAGEGHLLKSFQRTKGSASYPTSQPWTQANQTSLNRT